MRHGGAIFVLATLLTPLAMAGPEDNGTLLARGDASFPAGATLQFVPLLAMLNESGHLRALSIEARNVTIHSFEQPYTAVGTVHLSSQARRTTHEMREATIRLGTGDHGGYLAFLPPATGSATFTAAESFTLAARERTEVATGGTIGFDGRAGDTEEEPDHQQRLHERHFLVEAPGTLVYVGPAKLKLRGPDIQVAWEGRQATFPTGTGDWEMTVHQGVERWAILSFEDARVQIDSAAPWLLASAGTEARWDGRVGLHPVSGQVESDGRVFQATGALAWLEGRFSARLSVLADADHALLTRWDLHGTLTATTLRAQAMAQSPVATPEVFPWAWFLVGTVVMGGGAASAVIALHRRRPAPRSPHPPGAEDCLDAAIAAASNEDWPEAAEWFSRARRLAPTSARLCGDLAFALEQMGDVEEALRLYAEGSRLSTDGEADFNGAFAALRADRPPEEVAAWLVRALERSPELVADLEDDEALEGVRGVPAYEEAMRRAWERTGGEG